MTPSPSDTREAVGRLSLPSAAAIHEAAAKFSTRKDEDSVGALAWNFICMFRHLAALSQPETPGGGVTDQMVRAALDSRARDDEGEFEPMMDLLGFSASNKARTAMRAALEAALGAKPAEPKPKLGVLDFTGRVVVPPFRTWYELTRRVPYPGYGTEDQFKVVSRVMEAVGEYVEMLSTESRR